MAAVQAVAVLLLIFAHLFVSVSGGSNTDRSAIYEANEACETAMAPQAPALLCPAGFEDAGVSRVRKFRYDGGVCNYIEFVVCQCAQKNITTGCPNADCKQYRARFGAFGTFMGFEVNAHVAYKAIFKAYSQEKPQSEADANLVRGIFNGYYAAFLELRSNEFQNCQGHIVSLSSASTVHLSAADESCSPLCGTTRLTACENPYGGSSYQRKIPTSEYWPASPTRCSNENELADSYFAHASMMSISAAHRDRAVSVDDQNSLKLQVQAAITADENFLGRSSYVEVNKVDQSEGYLEVLVAVAAAAPPANFAGTGGRRLLGGGLTTISSGIENPECEAKFFVTITMMKGTKPKCVTHADSGTLCEPLVASTVFPFYTSDPAGLGGAKASNGVLIRPNNNPTTCLRLEKATREGVAAFRLEVAARPS